VRAARLFGPGDLRVVDAPRPEPGPDEALVKVVAYSPYGTDLGVFHNIGGRYVSQYPVGIGADFSAVVHSVGAEVENVKPGDRVSALALDHCGECAKCREGKTNLCLDPVFAKAARQICCQEYTTVCARKLARLPDNVSFDDGAMLAGLVDALNAYERVSLKPGGLIAVVGVGAMGMAAVATFVALGLDVVAIGGTGARVDLVRRLGAKAVVPLERHDQDVSEAALALFPEGFPAVMETTTSRWGLEQAFALAACEGTIALTGGGELPALSWDIVNRELRVMGVRAGHHQAQALDLINQGRLDLKPTITGRFSLEQAPEAFDLLIGPRARDMGRVIIDVGTKD